MKSNFQVFVLNSIVKRVASAVNLQQFLLKATDNLHLLCE